MQENYMTYTTLPRRTANHILRTVKTADQRQQPINAKVKSRQNEDMSSAQLNLESNYVQALCLYKRRCFDVKRLYDPRQRKIHSKDLIDGKGNAKVIDSNTKWLNFTALPTDAKQVLGMMEAFTATNEDLSGALTYYAMDTNNGCVVARQLHSHQPVMIGVNGHARPDTDERDVIHAYIDAPIVPLCHEDNERMPGVKVMTMPPRAARKPRKEKKDIECFQRTQHTVYEFKEKIKDPIQDNQMLDLTRDARSYMQRMEKCGRKKEALDKQSKPIRNRGNMQNTLTYNDIVQHHSLSGREENQHNDSRIFTPRNAPAGSQNPSHTSHPHSIVSVRNTISAPARDSLIVLPTSSSSSSTSLMLTHLEVNGQSQQRMKSANYANNSQLHSPPPTTPTPARGVSSPWAAESGHVFKSMPSPRRHDPSLGRKEFIQITTPLVNRSQTVHKAKPTSPAAGSNLSKPFPLSAVARNQSRTLTADLHIDVNTTDSGWSGMVFMPPNSPTNPHSFPPGSDVRTDELDEVEVAYKEEEEEEKKANEHGLATDRSHFSSEDVVNIPRMGHMQEELVEHYLSHSESGGTQLSQ